MKIFFSIVSILFLPPSLLLRATLFPDLLPKIQEHDVTAFVHVAVVPMTREQVILDQTVIIRKDRIAQIGPSRIVHAPESAFLIDGRGYYLMPGLCDMHVHLHSKQDAMLFLANGVTTVRNLRGTALHLAWRRQINEGKMIGPTIYTAGPMLDGFPPSGENATIIETPEDVDKIVAYHRKAGFDFVKVYNRLSAEAYRALTQSCKQNGLRVVGHVPTAVGLRGALAAHQASIEHLTAYIVKLKEDPLWRMYANRVPVSILRDLADATRKAGVWNCPTLVVQEKLASAQMYDQWKNRPEWRLVAPLRLKMWEPSRESHLQAMNEKDFAAARQGVELLKQMTKALAQSGAGILLGTDAPSRFVVPGFSAHEELANLVDAGLSPFEAIRAGTRDAAEFLGGLQEFGTVEVGKRADLLLLKGHPFSLISNTTRIAGVMVRGRWISQSDIQQILGNITASYAPKTDRFAFMPQLPEGSFARYSIRQNHLILGEERFVVTKLPNGYRQIHAQQVMDAPFDAAYLLDIRLDGEGRTEELHFRSERPEGEGQLQLKRQRDSIYMEANFPEQPETQMPDALSPEIDFSVSMVAGRLPFFSEIKGLSPDASTTKKMKELDLTVFFNREPELMDSTWNVHRDSANVFKFRRSWGRLAETGILVLDKDDLPLRYQSGSRTYERIE